MIETSNNGIFYQLNKKDLTAKVIYSPDAKGQVLIPQFIVYENQKYNITCIGEESFKNNQRIYSIEFDQDSELRSISKSAFSNSSLQSIMIPSKVEALQKGWCYGTPQLNTIILSQVNMFYQYLDEKKQIIIGKSEPSSEIFDTLIFAARNIKKAIIPSFIKHISSYSFSGCKFLSKISISENSELISIEKSAFSNSSLQEIFIPKSVKVLEEGWCHRTPKLVNVTLSPLNENFVYLNDKQKVIVGKSDFKIECFDTLVFAPRNIVSFTIPSQIRHICSFAFSFCSVLKSVDFEDLEKSKLESIGKCAFAYSSLPEISIPFGVTVIDEATFMMCKNLQKVDFSMNSKICAIKKGAFSHSSIRKISIPSCVETIDDFAFSFCELLETVLFEKNSKLNSICRLSFAHTSISSITVPSSVQTINDYAFSSCISLKSIDFESGSKLVSIGNNVFSDSSLENLEIPKNVKNVNENVFFNANNIKNIKISSENKHLIYYENKILLEKTTEDENEESFDRLIYSRRDLKEIIIPSSIKTISSRSFSNCRQLLSISFHPNSSLKTIEDYAFSTSSLMMISIPSSTKSIGKEAFYYCKKLKSVEILSDDVNIGKYCFSSSSVSIIAFPNAKNITVSSTAFPKHGKTDEYILFIQCGVEIDIIN